MRPSNMYADSYDDPKLDRGYFEMEVPETDVVVVVVAGARDEVS